MTFLNTVSVDFNEMAEFPLNWQLVRTGVINLKKDRYVSNLKINTEWSLFCAWSWNYPSKPEILEIRRNSTAKEILVSGTFKLMHNGILVIQRKFVQLIEAGFATTKIELQGLHAIPTVFYSDSSSDDSYDDDNVTKYSITGTLTISENTAEKEKSQFKSLLNLSNDFECLLDRNENGFSDVKVNCGTDSFSAHKVILSARSPVFAAMFTAQMKESRDDEVNISDISPQVLKTLLTYIYTGQIGNLSVEFAGELLFAADKYQLLDLKRVCGDYLKNYMSVENVLKTLVLGDFHDEDLKLFAIDFLCNSGVEFDSLEKTEDWKNFLQKTPFLAIEVLTSLVKSKNQKLKERK